MSKHFRVQAKFPHLRSAFPCLAVLACTLILGCASVSVQRLEPPGTAVKLSDTVAVLNELPSVPYRSIARIEVRDRGRGRSAEQLRRKLISTAAKLGANAVVIESPSTYRNLFVGPGLVSHYDDLMVAGLAIVQQSTEGGGGSADDPTPNPSLQRLVGLRRSAAELMIH